MKKGSVGFVNEEQKVLIKHKKMVAFAIILNLDSICLRENLEYEDVSYAIRYSMDDLKHLKERLDYGDIDFHKAMEILDDVEKNLDGVYQDISEKNIFKN